ncbi:MAG: NTP transferase domain-containing protein [Candidatus Magasanikbacteria bacterium]|nr:NTP transferase domain-containing protein [Candidatus Magasanikbacteria bacterium]
MENNLEKFGAVILAAGKGTRLGCTDRPKVMLELAGKPIVGYTVDTLEKIGLSSEKIILVVGFCHEVVEKYFGNRATFAMQNEQRGTAHAAMTGMRVLPTNVTDVLVMGGDDSAFYTPETLVKLMNEHVESGATTTLLTVKIEDPGAYGRVVYEAGGVKVIEKEYVSEEQKKINEVSTGTYCFKREWFETMFPNLPLLEKLNEWVLPMAFAEAHNQGLKQHVVCMENSAEWFGVNTPAELIEAQRRKSIN